MLANEVQLLVHLAATVDFNTRLSLALQMNTLGGLRVLAFAKTCTKLEAMVHTSTCYVNCIRKGRDVVNEEAIYPLSFDAEGMCKYILSLHESEVDRESARLLRETGFPNTYTLTKNIGERLVLKYKEHVPVVVVRPSIIGCSLQ
uniref:Fatty acyl-CoA reductase n=1 Tax=Lygus hesperus TaxID=30085 RepID=A0A0A9YCK5_LYGHE